MELLLNLTWLLLGVPACWLWRRTDRRAGSLQCLLTLACALVLLFPVVSATDDLHAMRPEMEESSPTKRALKQGSGEKLTLQYAFGAYPAQLLSQFPFPVGEFCGNVCPFQELGLRWEARTVFLGRAPPLA